MRGAQEPRKYARYPEVCNLRKSLTVTETDCGYLDSLDQTCSCRQDEDAYVDQELKTLQDITDMARSPSKNTLCDIGIGFQGIPGRIKTDVESP